MMLKSIEMQGFKSFVDKSKIEINAPICAIVGPNGSGKSNISDAVRWVLGEQSVKSLRGDRMEDVIFSGTPKRKPHGFAEVTLTLDNSDGSLSVAYDEVAVTRRVYRSGESEYFINKTPQRLKDIHALFMDTGLGRDGYSIIGQGKIDEILYAKPEERRAMFEEAAGISKYKHRKNEAMRKLSHTEDNLVRIEDIHKELSDKLDPLLKESEKATRFLELSGTLKGLTVTVATLDIEKNRGLLTSLKESYDTAEQQLNDAKHTADVIEAETTEYFKLQKTEDEEIQKDKQKAAEIQLTIANLENSILVKNTEIEHRRGDIVRIETEMAELDRAVAAADFTVARDELSKAQVRQSEIKTQIDSLGREEAKEKMRAIDAEFSECAKKLDELQYKKEANRVRLDSFDTVLVSNAQRKEALEKELYTVQREAEEHTKEIETQRAELTKKEKEKNELLKEKNELIAEFDKTVKQADADKEKYNTESTRHNQDASRLKLLEELERDMDGFTGAVRQVLTNKNLHGVCGVLSSLIEVKPEYVTAVEIALGNNMQNIVVKSTDDAKAAITFLKEKKAGRATFLPLDVVRARTLPKLSYEGFLGSVFDLIECAPEYKAAVSSLTGNVAVAKTYDDAVKMFKSEDGKIRIVTLTGEYLAPGGAITGGSAGRTQGFLSRKQEIARLKEKVAAQKTELDRLERAIDKGDNAINKMREKSDIIREKLSKNDEFVLRTQSQLEVHEKLCEKCNEQINSLLSEREKICYELEHSDKAKEELACQLVAFESEIAEKNAALDKLSARRDETREYTEKLDRLALDLSVALNDASRDIQMLSGRLESMTYGVESKTLQREEKSKQIEKINAEIDAIVMQIESVNAEIKRQKVAYDTQCKAYEEKQQARLAGDREHEKLRERAKQTQETILALTQETERLSARLERAQQSMEEQIAKLWDEYELTFSDALEQRVEIQSLTAAQGQISQIKREIKSLGDVYVGAIEEYKQVKERHEFLSAQKNDLLEAKKDLLSLINEMTTVMSKQFTARFEEISKRFADTYVALTGGGTGRLSLSEGDDVLEAGIEIEIQPPGKRLQNIMLLSGGEKALAAIALLFALLAVRPAPFCILDEIEAALDESNVGRFAAYMRNYKGTQFIVITHRRATMENADLLYGVTMQEKGVSRLISMRLDEVPAT